MRARFQLLSVDIVSSFLAASVLLISVQLLTNDSANTAYQRRSGLSREAEPRSCSPSARLSSSPGCGFGFSVEAADVSGSLVVASHYISVP